MTLPVEVLIPRLRATLADVSRAVLRAPPGAGKTTRVPIALLGANWLAGKKIIMLEPRRLAARAAARYMASALGELPGGTVGYRVRQDSRIGPGTRVEVVTEGVFTRLMQEDPALEGVGAVIFDEFHERNLHSDLGLALCLDMQGVIRPDLRILVMSATLDTAAIAGLLDGAPVLSSEGRSFPVDVRYRPLRNRFARNRRAFSHEVAHAVINVLREESGSVLVFLPGIAEIRQVETMLGSESLGENVVVTPLHSQLPMQAQDRAIRPIMTGRRKVVLATSIAETSLTIEGIRVVIDAGLMRVPRFDAATGLSRLETLPASQAAADQRCGRAGREQAGVCFRLWAEHTHLVPYTQPEIVNADLAPLMLELAHWGVHDVDELRWLDRPPEKHVHQASALLNQLGALDAGGRITAHGRAMVAFGAHPRLAHMMLQAGKLGYGRLACDLAATIEEPDLLRGIDSSDADIVSRIELLRRDNYPDGVNSQRLGIVRATAQRWQSVIASELTQEQHVDLALAGVVLAFAYPDRIGQRRQGRDNRFLLSNGRGAFFADDEPLGAADYIVAAHLDDRPEARIFLASSIHQDDLLLYHDELVKERCNVVWDELARCVRARCQLKLGELVVEERDWDQADQADIQDALLEGIRRHAPACLPWTAAARQLQARMNFLHRIVAKSWPDVSDAALVTSLETWLLPHLHDVTRLVQLKRLDMHRMLLDMLSWEQREQLDALAPARIVVPSGSRIAIDYSHETPVLAVRLQEMFGMSDTPAIAGGRVPLLLHLLSPASRPVQITGDLNAFWRGSYHEVKKELKGRYPKHNWPEDPLSARPDVRGLRKR